MLTFPSIIAPHDHSAGQDPTPGAKNVALESLFNAYPDLSNLESLVLVLPDSIEYHYAIFYKRYNTSPAYLGKENVLHCGRQEEEVGKIELKVYECLFKWLCCVLWLCCVNGVLN